MKTNFKKFFVEKLSGKQEKFVILLPGGYKPPTLGHYELIKKYSEHPSVEKVFVLIGPTERDSFTREQSLKVFDLYGVNKLNNVEIISSNINSPLQDCFNFIANNPKAKKFQGFTFGIGASDKGSDRLRAERLTSYFAANPMKLPSGLKVGIPPIISSTKSQKNQPVSATDLREAILLNDKKTIRNLIPKHIKASDFLKIFTN